MEIEKNVPIPQSWAHQGKTLANFLRQLEVGDSFLNDGKHSIGSVMSTGRSIGIKLLSRRTEAGTRIWRIK